MIKLIFVTLLLVIGMTGQGNAAPLVGLAFGSAFASTLPGILLGLAANVGASYLLNQVLGGQGAAANDNQDPAQVSFGERVARGGQIGRKRLGGHFVHYNEFDDAKKAQHVYVLADQWCDDLESVYVNGRQYDLIEVAGPYANNEARRYQVADYGTLIDIRFHDGRPGQLADTELITQTPGWDADRKYTNQCYVAVTLTSDKEKFNGRPDFKFVLRGARLYDPRKDTSVGGAGTHRFDDPTTWEYSANPAVGAYHFSRGFYANGRRVLGAQLASADIEFETYITAMNVCDEQVQRPDGSWRNRYEVHMSWLDTDQPSSVLDRMCAAMGGRRGEKQGRIAIFAGKAKVPVLTITDGDLVLDAPVRYSPKRPGALLFSGIHGLYTHSTEFTPTPYAALEPPAFIAQDKRSVMQPSDLPDVQDAHQAYLLIKQQLFTARLQATAQLTLDIKDLMLEVNDWIVWESASSLRGTKTYEITATQLNWQTGRLQLSLQQIDATAYADDATAAQVIEAPRPRPLSSYQKDVFGFGVSAVALSGANGENLPALKFVYNPIVDPAIRGLKIEYRVLADTKLFKATDTSIGDGEFYASDGIMPGLTYEARAVLDALPGREVNWTNWVPIDVPTGPMIVALQPGQVDYSHLAQDLGNVVGVLNATGAGSLSATLDYIINELERFASEVTGETVNAHVQRQLLQVKVGSALSQILTESTLRANGDTALADLLVIVSAEVDDAAAAILVEQTARADADGALAVSLNETIAAMGDAYAQGLFKIDAVANGGGTETTMTLKARASDGLGFVDTGLQIIAKSDGTSQIVLVAEETVIIDGNGDLLALFGGDGLINSAFIPSLTVSELSALSADLGDITAGNITLASGKFRLESVGRLVIAD
ncbi:hypothetical protein [Maritalea sp.]|jgi:hypothetical protein|uniref:hypothetical protein n=1 Tax=Maritalea sp. TaxID=2003361 RepID=UPI0039E342B3